MAQQVALQGTALHWCTCCSPAAPLSAHPSTTAGCARCGLHNAASAQKCCASLRNSCCGSVLPPFPAPPREDGMAAAVAAPAPGLATQGRATHGVESYYQQRLDEIDLAIRERTENLQRLRAQRNELNSKGACRARRRRGVGVAADSATSVAQCACCGRNCSCCWSRPAALETL